MAEFYAVEDALADDLAAARRQSWLIVAAVFGLCGLALFGIVRAGGRTIDRQQERLRAEAERSRAIARQNVDLRQRAVGAAARAAAQTERTLRQVGADLHDGPAQYLGLAALRLERVLPDTEAGREEAEASAAALNTALAEIRSISRGLSLPDLDRLTLAEVAQRAVEAHPRHAEAPVGLRYDGPPDPRLDASARICAYRFLQEALSNAARHAAERAGRRRSRGRRGCRRHRRDRGPGLRSGAAVGPADGGQGLAGLRDRAESIGGEVEIESAAGRGTTLRLRLPRVRRNAMSIRVVLADDHPIFREGLVRSIAEDPDFAVVGEAGTAERGGRAGRGRAPGPGAPRHLDARRRDRRRGRDRARFPGTRIAMLTVSENDHDVLAAMKAGAIGYVLKGVSASGLLAILREVAAGNAHVSPSLAQRVLVAMQARRNAAPGGSTRISPSARRTSSAASPAASATRRWRMRSACRKRP